ncbi:MAG TPA: hypothetical protein VGN70_04365 [Gammaproteobacteria bacterium]
MRLRILSLTFLVVWFASIPVRADDTFSDLNKKVDSGKNVVVLFVSDEETAKYANTQDDGDSEFYSDWYFYLGTFVKDQGSKVIVYKMSVADARLYFHSDKAPEDEWSIAFMKKGESVLYSPKPIMDPKTFQFASDYFDGKTDTKQAKQLGLSFIKLH